jgi:hypothetical protein
MFKMARWFIWGLFSLLLLTVIDQVLLRVDLPVPGYTQVHEFYVDFRTRLLGLTGNDSVARMITTNKTATPVAQAAPALPSAPATMEPRYLYVDGDGALQFVDTLDQVPLQYRRDAQPLSE